ncbi:MAG: lysine 2,3-aminomutase, partial [Thermodesulfobacteriota bacterium]
MIRLSEDELHAMIGAAGAIPLAITPYYMSLIDPWNPRQALRRTVVPTVHEHFRSSGEADDPLHEDEDSPVPGIVHRYPDRVLFLVTGICATYCRYCTRSRMVGHQGNHCLNT